MKWGVVIGVIIVVSLFYSFYELGYYLGTVEGIEWMRDVCIENVEKYQEELQDKITALYEQYLD